MPSNNDIKQDHPDFLTGANTNSCSSSLEEIERSSNDPNSLDRITSQFDNSVIETLRESCRDRQDIAEDKYLEYLGKRTSDQIPNCSLSSNKPSNITKFGMNSSDL